MRLVMVSLAAMTTSTLCVGLLFLYALVAPTRPAPTAAITGAQDIAWSAPAHQNLIAVAADVR